MPPALWYQVHTVRIYGLTGGIASGKTSVGKMFRKLGAPIIDADLLAREVVQPGSDALADIEAHFGRALIQEDGQLDRKALGALVFADEEARAALNRITHPRIAAAGQAAAGALAESGEPLALYEAALIVENQLHLQNDMCGLIVVSVPENVQIERLQARDGIDEAAARARIAAQLPLAEKLKVATHVIDNSGSLADTESQVTALWAKLSAAS
jgi:dephospho-CoA kinase